VCAERPILTSSWIHPIRDRAFFWFSFFPLHYDAAMKRRLRPFILLATLCPSLAATDKPSQEEAVRLLQLAANKSNIFQLSSFSMKATIQVDVLGKPVDGTYELLWNGADQWREDVSIPGYREVQIGGKGVVWVHRNINFIPVAILNLHRALGFGSSAGVPPRTSLVRMDLGPKDRVTGMRKRDKNGERLTCIDVEDSLKRTEEKCIRDDSGTLIGESGAKADTDLQPVGDKIFPRTLSLIVDGKTFAKVSITALATGVQFPAEAFAPPAGISPRNGCMNPVGPRLAKTQAPHYPEAARSRRIEGTTATYVTIGIDGAPRIQKVVESRSPDLEASSLDAIKQWRYDPALCNGQPVDVDTILEVHYTLSR
jgi:TonB family protein